MIFASRSNGAAFEEVIRKYLTEMTSETKKQILQDCRIQRNIAEKINRLEKEFDK